MDADELANALYEVAVPVAKGSALGNRPEGVPPLTPAQEEWVRAVVARAERAAAIEAISRVLGALDGAVPSHQFWGTFQLLYDDEPVRHGTELESAFRTRAQSPRRG